MAAPSESLQSTSAMKASIEKETKITSQPRAVIPVTSNCERSLRETVVLIFIVVERMDLSTCLKLKCVKLSGIFYMV